MTLKLAAPPPLRLMIYDVTDDETRIDVNGRDADGGEFVVPLGLSHSWLAGGKLYRALRWVDECLGVESWDEALDWLAVHGAPRRIASIQIWGHGGPGLSVIGRSRVTSRSPTSSEYESRLRMIGQRMTTDGVVWFRNCSVFAGEPGHRFARAWSQTLNTRIAAHTHVIGPLQSGLHTCGPGEYPRWPTTEGIAEGTPARPLKLRASMPWSPNTVTMLHSRVPKRW